MSLVMPHPRKPRGLLISPDLTVSGSHPFFIEHPSIRRSSLFQVFEFVSDSGVFRTRSLETFYWLRVWHLTQSGQVSLADDSQQLLTALDKLGCHINCHP